MGDHIIQGIQDWAGQESRDMGDPKIQGIQDWAEQESRLCSRYMALQGDLVLANSTPRGIG